MGIHVIALYRPKPNGDEALAAEVQTHVPELRRLGLATETPALVLRAADGTLLEHFEWASQDAIDKAHEHPDVLAMWGRFAECCDFATLDTLPNAGDMFPEFTHLGTF